MERLLTVKSATAAYWMPVTLRSVEHKPSMYEGFGHNAPGELDDWLEEGLDMFSDIYGTVIDAYYLVSEVIHNEQGNYDFILDIVVTGMVDSEVDFEDNILNHWPKDIVEQLKVANENYTLGNVIGCDYNPILNNPEWDKLNY